jgi:hypothetical protein
MKIADCQLNVLLVLDLEQALAQGMAEAREKDMDVALAEAQKHS